MFRAGDWRNCRGPKEQSRRDDQSGTGGDTVSLRFRKSIKIGKFARISMSKSGVGASVGVPGFRIGMGADGKVRRTVGIPGTGVYDTEVVASPKKEATKPKRTCQACGRQAGQRDRFCRYCGARLAT